MPPLPRKTSSGMPVTNNTMNRSLSSIIAIGVVLFFAILLSTSTSYVVEPGTRGIKVTLGKATEQFLPAGFGFKTPFITTVVPINVRQKTQQVHADCFSSDLQQVVMD